MPTPPHALDRLIRQTLEETAVLLMQELFALPIAQAEPLETQFKQVEELRADVLLRLTHPDRPRPMILHLEAQSQDDPRLIGRMLRVLSHLAERYPHCDLLQAILWLGPGPCPYRPETPLGESLLRLRVIDLTQLPAERFLQSPAPQVALLAVLCALPEGWGPEELLDALGKRLTEIPERRLRQDLYLRLEILASRRGWREVLHKRVKTMGWTIAIEELPSYREGLDEGLRKGLDEGLRKGLDEGLRKGLEEGRLEGERRALRLLLETRFGPLPQWVDERLAGIGDEDELTCLFQRALAVGSLDELF